MQVDGVLGYLAKITRFDRSAFTPLFIAGQPMGCVNQVWLARLLESEAALFRLQADGLHCTVEGDYAAISHQLDQAAKRWQAAGWLNGWRNENFTAFLPDATPLFELERAAFRPLGLTSRAVHLNGLTRLPDGEVRMWLGRRSPDKAVDPNRMDNMMGGGIAAGESIELALEREGWEEAGIPADKLELLPQTGVLLAERPVQRGLHREWLHVYDLWLSGKEEPCNQDGEVAEHVCVPLAEVENLLVAERFMIDAALVAIDCLLRLQYWGPHNQQVADAMADLRFQPGFDEHAAH
ncbi:NUDIX hydrolase [Aquitalea magnusonii]|nr:NUDIX hydrolase [Aquitalea magnusonii]